jgi:WD40 repeat protein
MLTLQKLKEIQIGSVSEGVSAAMWANSSSRIAVACNKELRLINIAPEHGQSEEWLVMYRSRLHQHAYDAVLSADGGTFVSVGQDRMLRFTRMSDNKVVTRGPEPAAVTCLSRSSDGKFLASNLSNGCIHVWQLGNLEPISDDRNPLAEAEDPLDKLPSEPLYTLKGLKLSHPGRFVIRSSFGGADNAFVGTGSESSLVHIWHRESSSLVASVEGHSATVNAVAWNPLDDHMLASASDDHEVIIWVSQKCV